MKALTPTEWRLFPTVTRTVLKSGDVIYRPRNGHALKLLYKIDTIRAGFRENEVKNKKMIIVDVDDNVISYSRKAEQFHKAQ
jgi:hypothetical protein